MAKVGRVVGYGIRLGISCVAAFLATPWIRSSFARDHEHRGDDASLTLVSGTAMHAALSGLVESLELGSATLDQIGSVIESLVPCLLANDGDEPGERRMGIECKGTHLGELRIPLPQEDGRRDWTFELKLPPLPRHGALGGEADLAITFSGNNGVIRFVSALVQTHVHASKAVIAEVEANPLLLGGCYRVDETSAQWNSFVLEVKVPPDTRIPLWTNRMGKVERREPESLQTGVIEVVGAALFAL